MSGGTYMQRLSRLIEQRTQATVQSGAQHVDATLQRQQLQFMDPPVDSQLGKRLQVHGELTA
nr:hypothetical protein GCM10020185_78830 [Pseudomonas brassicacearum subsp. brassicacearum]